MKKLIPMFFILGLLLFYAGNSCAICIGCGCGATYSGCVSGNGSCGDGMITTRNPDGTPGPRIFSQAFLDDCCGNEYNQCHKGFGIFTHWWGAYSGALPQPSGTGGVYAAFSVNGNVLGSHNGGQVIKPLSLCTPEELLQLAPYQSIINKYLAGEVLTQEELVAIDVNVD